MKRILLLALLAVPIAGCGPTSPAAVLVNPSAKPLDRIAAAESIYNSTMTLVLIARQDKLIDDAQFHRIRVASDAFVAAIASSRTSVAGGAPLDGNAFWAAANAALQSIVDAQGQATTQPTK